MKINATISAYNRYHKAYDDETAYFWDSFPKEVLYRFVRSMNGKRVLDMGSGTGRDAKLLKDNGLEVTCVDASKRMIEYTRKLGFKSLQCDMRTLPFAKGSFDGIWAYTSLIHLRRSDTEKVIRNIHSILKQNGTILVGAIKGEFSGYVHRNSMPGAKRYFEYYSDDSLSDLVCKSGFKLIYKKNYKPKNKTYINHIYKRL